MTCSQLFFLNHPANIGDLAALLDRLGAVANNDGGAARLEAPCSL
jgi:hypothetical protein